ncbi:hypothetical protein A0H81_09227 [Grifola frondosa]|uniref:Uncharacterized protein n=1 Tax=Grifola frondosa TaxID=5627 RepID=A0A1C7M1K5_GRIFR|nr:hypothetical protein A0H81_09227 [Grifola frondosa]
MPSQPLSLLPSGSPFAYNADTPLTRLRSRPHSHSPTSSITTPHVPASSHPYAQLAPEPISTPEPPRRTHTFSQSYPTPLPSPSQATPATFTPTPPSSSSSTSTTIPRRQLPIPPGPPPLSHPSQPWIHTPPQTSPSTSTAPVPLPLPPTPSTSRSVSSPYVAPAQACARSRLHLPAATARNSAPPKLAQEYTSPRTHRAGLVGSRVLGSRCSHAHAGLRALENTGARACGSDACARRGRSACEPSLDLGRPPLRVVNADGGSAPAHVQGQGQVRQSYAESVYEMPPPAYDAIDFSVRFRGCLLIRRSPAAYADAWTVVLRMLLGYWCFDLSRFSFWSHLLFTIVNICCIHFQFLSFLGFLIYPMSALITESHFAFPALTWPASWRFCRFL